jgi:hypothetical protein
MLGKLLLGGAALYGLARGLGSAKHVHRKQRNNMLAIGKNHLRDFTLAMRRGQCMRATQELLWANMSAGAAAENDAHMRGPKDGFFMFADPQIDAFMNELQEASQLLTSTCVKNGRLSGLSARKKSKKRYCIVSVRDKRVKFIRRSFESAVEKEGELPLASHFLIECEPHWRIGTRVPY